jgi:glucosamine 6-phosphate synthetase-like amidotransferase/phosphosugar isomerase protein
MCGISGVCGPRAPIMALQLILGQLERGTLGCGVAFTKGPRISVLKAPIHPIQFIGKYFVRLDRSSVAAIAHNRMPSRGAVSYLNTHPFVDCSRSFAIVHNGNVLFKRSTILKIKKDHRILGETDSEIACHIVEQYYNMHGDMVTALAELADTEFRGAILVLYKNGEIYGLRKGLEPICYCAVDGHVLIASSENAIRNLVNKKADIRRLKSGQIIKVKGLDVSIHDTDSVDDFELMDDYALMCDFRYPYSWRQYFRKANSLCFTF